MNQEKNLKAAKKNKKQKTKTLHLQKSDHITYIWLLNTNYRR